MTTTIEAQTQDVLQETGPPLPSVTLEEALADPDPLIRYQAKRQRAYERGDLDRKPDARVTLERLREVWQRNREITRGHRVRFAAEASGSRVRRTDRARPPRPTSPDRHGQA